MALLWAEPFDQYGGSVAAMSAFGYTNVNLTGLVNGQGRTGNYAAQTFNNGDCLRVALTTPVANCGQGCAWKFNGAPGTSSNCAGFVYYSAGAVTECTVVCQSDFSIAVYDRTGTFKGKSAANVLINGSYGWVEAKVIGNTAGVNTGSVIVKVQGQTVLTVNGINLPNSIAFMAQLTTNGNYYFDDWIMWDTTGTVNNDFMGDRRLYLSVPNANGIPQDFTASAGSAFNCVNQIPAVDTTYIQGAAAGNVSEFAKGAIGIGSNDIAAMVVIGRLFKSDAGAASGRVGIDSAGNVLNSIEYFPGTTGAWFKLFTERDPNGTIAWTRAAADAANIVITRVT